MSRTPATGDLGRCPRARHLQGLDLELLNPLGDEDELRFLIEARHTEYEDALRSHEEVIVDGEPFSPRLHVAMHQVVANQLLADNCTRETWRTVQRLFGLGYDWHNVMHMIAALVSKDVYTPLRSTGSSILATMPGG